MKVTIRRLPAGWGGMITEGRGDGSGGESVFRDLLRSVLSAPPLKWGDCTHVQVLAVYITDPLLLPMKRSLGEESFIRIKAGDKRNW